MSVRVLVVAMLGATCLGLVSVPIQVGTTQRYGCVLCRREYVKHTVLGVPVEISEPRPPFSEWYDAHRGQHEHLWASHGCRRGWSLVGTTTLWTCSTTHAVFALRSERELAFLSHRSPADVDAFFEDILSDDGDRRREAVWIARGDTDDADP